MQRGEWKADVVNWNGDYEPRAITRDRQVQQQLAQTGMLVRTFKDLVLCEAEEVRGVTGEPMQRYSAYRARWWAKRQAIKPVALSIPKTLRPAKSVSLPSPPPLPTAGELGYDPLTPWIEPGEQRAQKRLRWFLKSSTHRYVDDRNLPGSDGSSKLSPHFCFGTLWPRTAVHGALGTLAEVGRISRPDVLTWIDELIWRELFQQVLAAFPRVVDGPSEPPRSRPFVLQGRNGTGYSKPGVKAEPAIRSWMRACGS
ncbi:MAG: deoxyribodipyrimidine photo-lyase [Nitrospira sp.]